MLEDGQVQDSSGTGTPAFNVSTHPFASTTFFKVAVHYLQEYLLQKKNIETRRKILIDFKFLILLF